VKSVGPLEITVDGRRVGSNEWESAKAQEFFAFLMCHRHGKTREELIEVLWPEGSANLSRNAFHNNVFRTRRALYKGCVVLDGGRYRINPAGHFSFDLEEIRRLSTEAVAARESPKRQIQLLVQSVELYRGEFLPGINSDWVTPIRMEVEGIFVSNLLRLAALYDRQGDCGSAIAALERVLQVEPTDVETQERVVKMLIRAGHPTEARQRHERFRRLMLDEATSGTPA
jgi:two-component SAPR family response regulator